ncbi:endonuclease/exonuclease/phosphatase family protein [Kribbella jejuensis]|uniref:endonuclease/exonuclease/phosphatase family protein n=1 Tax=Kribbella jejuensis TaxID=236068 RepID=UPI001EE1F411|nr:endonuclease/exonuclease/phosphatase family protein [Kribbella jejuensis]
MFGLREDWLRRRELIAAGFAEFGPQLVALQEVVTSDSVDQVVDVLGDGYQIVHHAERERDGQGISIASRWPITGVHEIDLQLGPRPAGFACSALVTEIAAPTGRMVFVNHLPDWQLTHEAERERQTVAVARFIEDLAGDARVPVVVAGDMDATPDAASIRFWTGKQSLDGISVCYRDCWTAARPPSPGHTFTPENHLTTTAEVGDWELELGRRIDYILVRCSDHGPSLYVEDCRRLFDKPSGHTWPSDHFGVGAVLSPVTPTGRPVP